MGTPANGAIRRADCEGLSSGELDIRIADCTPKTEVNM
jgi:hypothetical protein